MREIESPTRGPRLSLASVLQAASCENSPEGHAESGGGVLRAAAESHSQAVTVIF
jgi:hypothetical protein